MKVFILLEKLCKRNKGPAVYCRSQPSLLGSAAAMKQPQGDPSGLTVVFSAASTVQPMPPVQHRLSRCLTMAKRSHSCPSSLSGLSAYCWPEYCPPGSSAASRKLCQTVTGFPQPLQGGGPAPACLGTLRHLVSLLIRAVARADALASGISTAPIGKKLSQQAMLYRGVGIMLPIFSVPNAES